MQGPDYFFIILCILGVWAALAIHLDTIYRRLSERMDRLEKSRGNQQSNSGG